MTVGIRELGDGPVGADLATSFPAPFPERSVRNIPDRRTSGVLSSGFIGKSGLRLAAALSCFVTFQIRVGAACPAQVEAQAAKSRDENGTRMPTPTKGRGDDGAGGECIEHDARFDALAGADLEALLVALGESVGLPGLVDPVGDMEAISSGRQLAHRPHRVRRLENGRLDAALQPNQPGDDPGGGGRDVAGLLDHDDFERSGRGLRRSVFERETPIETHPSSNTGASAARTRTDCQAFGRKPFIATSFLGVFAGIGRSVLSDNHDRSFRQAKSSGTPGIVLVFC